MALSMLCPGCGALFRAADESIGKSARCTKCEAVFVLGAASVPSPRAIEPIPAGSTTAVPLPPPPMPLAPTADAPMVLSLAEPEPSPVAVDQQPAPRSVRRSRPTPRKSESSPWPIALAIGGGALVLLIGFGVVMAMVFASTERRRARIMPPAVAIQPAPVAKDVDFPAPPMAQRPPGPPPKHIPLALQNGFAKVQANLTNQDAADRLRPGCGCKAYRVRLQAGKTYVIDHMGNFDPYLRLEDVKGTILAQDDDGGGGLNARITIIPARTDDYLVMATSFRPAVGDFTLTVREQNAPGPFGR